uniref:Translationally-controlled tumor protein n=1 Tax=Marmota marmota marmota TaxID=9994 RepID=A0A8C5ZQJ1_MARMA
MVPRTEGNTGDMLMDTSAERPKGKGAKSTVITGIDIIMNHPLQATSFTKEAYKKYIKNYIKSKANLKNRDQRE